MRLLAALLVLVPCSALSQSVDPQSVDPQSPSPQPQPAVAVPAPAVAAPSIPVAPAAVASPAAPAEPLWSIGAGLLVDPVVIMTSAGGGIFEVHSPPSVAASLERRLSARSWLVVDLTGRVARYRQELEAGEYGMTKEDSRQLEVSAGLRRRLTSSAAPVDVSLLALANVGVISADGTSQSFSGPPEDRTTLEWSAGADLGLAVERELADGLSLRVATPLAGVTWRWSRTEIDGASPQDGSNVALAIALAPRIELRLAF